MLGILFSLLAVTSYRQADEMQILLLLGLSFSSLMCLSMQRAPRIRYELVYRNLGQLIEDCGAILSQSKIQSFNLSKCKTIQNN